MPSELKERLTQEVAARGSNLNDIAVGILASKFAVPFTATGRKGTRPRSGGEVLLRMPAELKDRLSRRASERRRNVNDLIVETLALGLGKDTMAQENGKRRDQGSVRVALIGVGNCANALLQGLEYYKDAPADQFVPGLMHDGIGKYLSEVVEKAPGETDDVVGILRETNTDVVVNYLPVGSEEATKWYTEQILQAGCAMVNCMPVFIAREAYWQRRFEQAGVPIIGDDIKSQVGATITHRVLTTLFRERGVRLDRTMQLNVGGNSDFLNMLERERLESKKISKTNAVTSMLDYDLGPGNVHVGPSDHVPWLTDRKWAFIRMEGSSFGDVPLNIELKLEVWDSPNSAGIVIDAVRLAKLALNDGVAGALEGPSGYLMKSPPKQIVDDEAYEQVERFIKQHARTKVKEPARA
jgi:myo-inositol-1-phosphate synthase